MPLSSSKFINYIIDNGCYIANDDKPWMKTIHFINPRNHTEFFLFRSPKNDKIEKTTIVLACTKLGIQTPDYTTLEYDE